MKTIALGKAFVCDLNHLFVFSKKAADKANFAFAGRKIPCKGQRPVSGVSLRRRWFYQWIPAPFPGRMAGGRSSGGQRVSPADRVEGLETVRALLVNHDRSTRGRREGGASRYGWRPFYKTGGCDALREIRD